MLKFPSVITAENFDDAWKYTTRKYRTAKKLYVMRTVLHSVGQIVFLLVALMLSYGALLTHAGSGIVAHLKRFSFLIPYWDRFRVCFFSADLTRAWFIARVFGLAYLLPLAIGLVFCIPVVLLYHPIVSKRTGDIPMQALELSNRARKADLFNRKAPPATASFCCVLYAVTVVAFLVSYVLSQTRLPNVGYDITNSAPRISFVLGIACVGFILAYLILNIPLRLLIKLLFTPHLPKFFLHICDSSYSTFKKTAGPSPVPVEKAPISQESSQHEPQQNFEV